MSSKKSTPTQAFLSENKKSLNPITEEQQYVHDVYEKIAQHFSSTRYKPWPVVEEFFKELEIGSIGIDVGCGNGKYLDVNRNIYIIGADRSSNLIEISASRGFESLICDALKLPYRNECFVSFKQKSYCYNRIRTNAIIYFLIFNVFNCISPNVRTERLYYILIYFINLIKSFFKDFVTSIAVIHHFTTPERRITAIKV